MKEKRLYIQLFLNNYIFIIDFLFLTYIYAVYVLLHKSCELGMYIIFSNIKGLIEKFLLLLFRINYYYY